MWRHLCIPFRESTWGWRMTQGRPPSQSLPAANPGPCDIYRRWRKELWRWGNRGSHFNAIALGGIGAGAADEPPDCPKRRPHRASSTNRVPDAALNRLVDGLIRWLTEQVLSAVIASYRYEARTTLELRSSALLVICDPPAPVLSGLTIGGPPPFRLRRYILKTHHGSLCHR